MSAAQRAINTSTESAAAIMESQLDELFIVYMLEIDSRYKSMMKQDRVRVEQWVSQRSAASLFHLISSPSSDRLRENSPRSYRTLAV